MRWAVYSNSRSSASDFMCRIRAAWDVVFYSHPDELKPLCGPLARASVKHAIAFFVILAQIYPMTFKRITCDPKRMNGQPCVRQLRLTVRRVVEAVATYPDRRDLEREFPELEAEDIREALAYAAANLDDKVIELAAAG